MTVNCGLCSSPMVLRDSVKYPGRRFWGCVRWPECDGAHGAHPDGRPLGIPGDRETCAARMRAHAAFDQLWKGGSMSRQDAYRWMRRALGLSRKEGHIAMFNIEQCDALVRAALHKRSDTEGT